MSRSTFEGKLEKTNKTCLKLSILDLGHALLTHHEAPRIHKSHECHLEGSWEHLGAPHIDHMGAIWGSRLDFLGRRGSLNIRIQPM